MSTLPLRRVEIPEEIKMEVEKITSNYFLFGSRLMVSFWSGLSRDVEKSDWDIAFAYNGSEYSEVKRMKDNGWTPIERLKYYDKLSFAVYEKTIDVQGVPTKVQMCSKINLGLFKETVESLPVNFYWRFLHKSSPEVLPKEVQTEIFNMLYRVKGWV